MTALLAGIWEGSRLLFASYFLLLEALDFCRQTKTQRVISARSQHKDCFPANHLRLLDLTMDRRIELVISKIESDPGACQLSKLAALVNLSPSRLRHLFKQETGITPSQYVKESRLRKAELLLRTSFLSIKEIVNQVGLTSSGHFVREFRKTFEQSPTTYRKRNGLTNNKSQKKRLER